MEEREPCRRCKSADGPEPYTEGFCRECWEVVDQFLQAYTAEAPREKLLAIAPGALQELSRIAGEVREEFVGKKRRQAQGRIARERFEATALPKLLGTEALSGNPTPRPVRVVSPAPQPRLSPRPPSAASVHPSVPLGEPPCFPENMVKGETLPSPVTPDANERAWLYSRRVIGDIVADEEASYLFVYRRIFMEAMRQARIGSSSASYRFTRRCFRPTLAAICVLLARRKQGVSPDAAEAS